MQGCAQVFYNSYIKGPHTKARAAFIQGNWDRITEDWFSKVDECHVKKAMVGALRTYVKHSLKCDWKTAKKEGDQICMFFLWMLEDFDQEIKSPDCVWYFANVKFPYKCTKQQATTAPPEITINRSQIK
jgi:hypothetical protein